MENRLATWPELREGTMNQNLVSLTLYSPDRGKESVGRNWGGGGGIKRTERTNISSQNESILDEEGACWAEVTSRRKQLLL